MFAIRTCRKDCEKTVGNLPREISRPTKYLIDRGAKITAKLSSIHYRRSPLFPGLEIACEVTVTIPASIKGHLLMQHYEKMVHELYCEPKNETIMGSFIENINVDFDIQPKKKKKRHWKNCSKTHTEQRHSIFLPKKIMSKRYIYVTNIL